MRPVFVVLAALAATLTAGAPASAQDFRKLPSASEAARLQLDSASVSEGRGTKVYVVQMAAKPAAAYEGGTAGLAKTAPAQGQRYDARSSQAQLYTAHLGAEQDALLAKIGASNRKIYSYRHAMNGFAARLTAPEVARLRKDKSVLNVWEDQPLKLDTNNTVWFLGLNNPKKGLREKHKLRGKGVIVGMIDTGITQEHPSLDDTGLPPPPPAKWSGICQAGEGFAATDCNNKLIGARFFNAGFLAAAGGTFDDAAVPGEFESPRDSDGHGTHTATTAAGRDKVKAVINGTPLAKVSGMAPDAYLAIYKACWEASDPANTGCFFSDTSAATDTAVADGVDLISYSIGTAGAFNDPTDIAFLFATDAGVFVSRSAGNEGPGPGSTAAGEPWAISVAASTHNGKAFANAARVNSPASVAGDYPALEGAITKPLTETGPITDDVVAADPIDACTPLTNDIGGKIALIARGTCTFDIKLTNAMAANAGAVLLYTNPGNPKTVMGGNLEFDFPGVMIDNEPGVAILAELTGGATVNVTLSAAVFITERLTGKIMAAFSSRGPYANVPDWMKPDVTAPGVRILAGHTPTPNSGAQGNFFQYLQGTSMSTPHVTGIAALLIEEHPDWSPAQVKSALMTTTGRHAAMKKEDGVTPADPFDLGAGHIVPNNAIDPGLTYDAGFLDYLAASCGTVTPLVVPDDCTLLESLGFSLDPANLNLPSIGVAEVLGEKTITRTVTNVGKKKATYEAGRMQPPGFRMRIYPDTLTLLPGESKSYEIKFTNMSAPPGEWRFGQIVWRDGKGPNKGHVVRSPIAVKAQAISAPADISGTGADGATSFDVAFGYNGTYAPGTHGLVNAFPSLGEVGQDPDASFNFLDPPGEVLAYLLEIPPGTVYAQWSLFDEYVDGNHDLDIYLFYCPDFSCSLVDASTTATSAERVSVQFPQNDPAIQDPYALIVHGFSVEGGTGQFVLFDWTDPGPGADLGNMTVTGPGTATIGGGGTVNVNWTGLATGPLAKQVGAISHTDSSSILGLTIVNIANDPGVTFCDVVACP